MEVLKSSFLCRKCKWIGTDIIKHYAIEHQTKVQIKCLQCYQCPEFENEETYMAHVQTYFHVWQNAEIITYGE